MQPRPVIMQHDRHASLSRPAHRSLARGLGLGREAWGQLDEDPATRFNAILELLRCGRAAPLLAQHIGTGNTHRACCCPSLGSVLQSLLEIQWRFCVRDGTPGASAPGQAACRDRRQRRSRLWTAPSSCPNVLLQTSLNPVRMADPFYLGRAFYKPGR